MTDDITAADVHAQTRALVQIGEDLHRDNTERVRFKRMVFWATLFAAVLSIVDLLALIVIYKSSRQSAANGRDIKEVLTIVDPDSPAGKASAERQQTVVNGLVVEIDCRTRRAIAHLPPPESGKPCTP